MAFVSCGDFKTSQEDQDRKISKLQENSISAEDTLLDKSKSPHVITVGKVVEAINGLVGISVKTGSGLDGEGTKNNPLHLSINPRDLMVNSNGQLELVVKRPINITNLSNHLDGLGFRTFTGKVNNTGTNTTFVKGIPLDYTSTAATQAGASDINQLSPNQNYDFNGYYLASENEVIMTVMNNGITWTRSNESGMNLDGSLKNENDWSDWKRETNVNISAEMVGQHTAQIQDLLNRLGSAEQKIANIENMLNQPCEVGIENVSNHTVTDNDNIIVSSGGIITFPNNLSVGRSFTVIRKGTAVTLDGVVSSSGKVIDKDNSAVTVLVVATGTNMAFGSLK